MGSLRVDGVHLSLIFFSFEFHWINWFNTKLMVQMKQTNEAWSNILKKAHVIYSTSYDHISLLLVPLHVLYFQVQYLLTF